MQEDERTWTTGTLPKARATTKSLLNIEDDDDHEYQDGRHLQRKSRAYSHGSRGSFIHHLDTWLYSILPTTLRSSLPSLALIYCVLSLWLFSGHITYLSRTPEIPSTAPQKPSTLSILPLDHLLSKLSSLHPLILEQDVLGLGTHNHVDPSAYTACLWAAEEELDQLVPWAEQWTGPMSLLITTPASRGSPRHRSLLSTLQRLHAAHPALRDTLAAHVLHLAPGTDPRPNALLNLARLLAPTPRVVLFPGNLSAPVPPPHAYRALLAPHSPFGASYAMMGTGRAHRQSPAVLTTREHAAFPFSALAPLVLARDDTVWCAERFFTTHARAVDWEECLWQVWLANFGDLDVRVVPGWGAPTLPAGPDRDRYKEKGDVEDAAMKIHRRLAAKFRSETCALAMRRFTALREVGSAVDTKKARWLKRVCRGWSSA